jgi:hypothetical protein
MEVELVGHQSVPLGFRKMGNIFRNLFTRDVLFLSSDDFRLLTTDARTCLVIVFVLTDPILSVKI